MLKKDIIGYDGIYTIFENGDIYSVKRKGSKGGKLKTYTDANGYAKVRLCKDGKGKLFYLHRLIAQHFIPNSDNKPCINHKDGNKLNNEISNIEWCTYSENLNHALKTGLNKSNIKRPITIGIDPGVHTGIFACNGTKIVHKQTIKPFLIDKCVKDIERNFGYIKEIYIEDPNENKPIFNRKVNIAQLLKIAQNVGSNKRDAQWIIEILTNLNYKVITVKPTSKKWDANTYERITGDNGRTSQHVRDAAKLAFGR